MNQQIEMNFSQSDSTEYIGMNSNLATYRVLWHILLMFALNKFHYFVTEVTLVRSLVRFNSLNLTRYCKVYYTLNICGLKLVLSIIPLELTVLQTKTTEFEVQTSQWGRTICLKSKWNTTLHRMKEFLIIYGAAHYQTRSAVKVSSCHFIS